MHRPSIALALTVGAGVAFSALSVLLVQGAVTLPAFFYAIVWAAFF